MPKYKICKHTHDYKKLVKALEDNHIEFKVKSCIEKCSKCSEKYLVQKDDEYISSKTIEKLLLKLDL